MTSGPTASVALRASVGEWEVEILGAGGRVTSLRYGYGGELLASCGRGWPQPPPTSWIDGDVRGWDECLPNIAPGVHPETGTMLPDHGDLWNTVGTSAVVHTGLRTSWRARSIGAEVRRELTGADQDLLVTYTCSAVEDIAAAWAMHLLLDATPAAVRLDPEAEVRVDSAFGEAARTLKVSKPDEWWLWRDVQPRLPRGTGWAAKLYTRPGRTSRVTVDLEGSRLTFSFDEAPIEPAFGVWLNPGGLEGVAEAHHVGIEPCFGVHDQLEVAYATGTAARLGPTPVRWVVRLQHVITRTATSAMNRGQHD